jgi:hypothetical protein
MGEHTPGPWTICCDGKCTCKMVGCSDHPIAKVISGEWGDEYPSVRLVGTSSLDIKAEGFMEMIGYGSVHEDVATANARLIAAAPDMYEALRALKYNQGNEAWKLADAALRKAEGATSEMTDKRG